MTPIEPSSDPLASDAAAQALPFGLDRRHCKHAVLFYLDENFLGRVLAEFVIASLTLGETAVILASLAHQRILSRRMEENGIDVSAMKREGRYVEVDADEILAGCMFAQKLDVERLGHLLGRALEEATPAGRPPISRAMVFGELAGMFWARRDFENLKAVEKFGDDMVPGFSLMCGYPIGEFADNGTEKAFVEICAMHPTIVPPDAYPTAEAEKRLTHATAHFYERMTAKPNPPPAQA